MEEKNHQKMIFDDEARRKFYAAELESGEHFLYNGKICHSNVMSKEGLDQLKNAEFPENAVTVLGFPKSGSHLMMSILDAMKITRLESLLPAGKVFFFPMSFTANVAHLSDHLAAINQFPGLVHTTHCHLTPESFPNNHKGKIIFIERETPAVVVSAFHFFKSLDHMIPFMKKHGIHDDLQEFAKFMFQGKFTFGRPEEYNAKWKKFAQENPQLNIEFFKFEEILADKTKEITKLVDFLEIKDANIAEIVKNSEMKKAREHREKEAEKLGIPFAEGALFRQGSSKGWKYELSEETIAFYESLK